MLLTYIEWAQKHDWYRSCFLINPLDNVFGVLVYDSELDKVVTFRDFKKLYKWAGY